MVARTRELKKRHRAPLVMPDDRRKGTYRRKRRERGGEAEEEEGSNENVSGASTGGEEERQIVFDQDEYGGKLREYLWTHGASNVHRGLIQIGREQTQETGIGRVPGLSFLVPHLYFEKIVDERRLREIDLEIGVEVDLMERSGGQAGSNKIAAVDCNYASE